MLITYTIDHENFPQLDVSQDLEVENFIALITMDNPALERIERSQLALVVNGTTWKIDSNVLKMKLYEIGINNNDMVTVMRNRPATATAQPTRTHGATGTRNAAISSLIRGIQVPSKAQRPQNPQRDMQAYIDSMVKRISPEQMRTISRNLFIQMASPLAQLRFKSEYPSAVAQYVKEPTDFEAFHNAIIADQRDFYRRLALTADPTSAEGQAMIADMIKREAHKEQLQKAMTEMPEAFIQSHMLYVKLKINGHDAVGFIDTGAQVSTISAHQAERCNIHHKIDKTFATIMRGVGGEQHSEGRVHSAEFEMNGHIFPAPLTVLQRYTDDVLIGLDTLRRHGACVDLAKHCLRLGKEGIEVPFLNEKEYADECKRLGLAANLPPSEKEPLPEKDVDNGKVAQLVNLGFDAGAALKALAKSHNDIAYACDILQTESDKANAELHASKSGPATMDQSKDDEPME